MKPRVLSLSPGATDALHAIGAGELLVGEGPPGAGDVFADRLAALAPDVVLVHDDDAARPAIAQFAGAMPSSVRIVRVRAATIEGVLDDMLRIGEAVGMEREAARAVVALRERLFAAEEAVNPYEEGPIVVFLESLEPLVVAGGVVAQLLERAGAGHPLNPTRPRDGAGAAVGPQRGERTAPPARVVSHGDVTRHAPDAVVVCVPRVGVDDAAASVRGLAEQPWWRSLPAVGRGRVAVVDGDGPFALVGPRLVDAFEWLVGWLHERPAMMPGAIRWRGVDDR